MKRLLTFIVLSSMFASTVAVGQVIWNSASTAAEGYANGVSNVISAQGQKNVNDSQARINNQDAYSQAIDNSVKSVNAFWEKKDIYSQRVQEQNYKIEQRRDMLLSKNAIQPLTSEEFDRTTGAIVWPKILEQTQYNQYRSVFDDCFKKRAYAGALTSDDYMTFMTTSKKWRDFLSSQRNTYPSPVLQQMIRFVLKLNREMDDNLG